MEAQVADLCEFEVFREFQNGQGYTEKSYPENPKSSMFQRRTLLFVVIFTQTQIFS